MLDTFAVTWVKLSFFKFVIVTTSHWSGFGMATVGIHPNNFGALNGHPNKIPTNKLLGDVV